LVGVKGAFIQGKLYTPEELDAVMRAINARPSSESSESGNDCHRDQPSCAVFRPS